MTMIDDASSPQFFQLQSLYKLSCLDKLSCLEPKWLGPPPWLPSGLLPASSLASSLGAGHEVPEADLRKGGFPQQLGLFFYNMAK